MCEINRIGCVFHQVEAGKMTIVNDLEVYNMNSVIFGWVAAGISAAMSIYRTDEQAHITILEQGEIYSYGQCGLPYVISGRVDSVQELIARQVDTFRNKYGMEARTRVEVTEIDEHKQTVIGFDHQAKEQFTVSYDKLLIATGAAPNVPECPGVDLSGIHKIGRAHV